MRTTIAFLLLGLVTSSLHAQDDVKINVLKMRETRVAYFDKELEKAASESFSHLEPDPGLELLLAIEGKALTDATSYGKLQIKKAVDDAGTDLKAPKKKGGFSFGNNDPDEFQRIEDESSHFADATKTEKGFRLKLMCGLPARKAETIKTLEGSLVVMTGGERKTIGRKAIASHYGNILDDPALKAAKLQIKVVDPEDRKGGFFSQNEEDQGKSVTLEFSGDLNALDDVEVLDKAGEDVTMSRMWSTAGGKQTTTYDLSEKLTDDMTLQINVFVGLKKVDVPLKLSDVKLP